MPWSKLRSASRGLRRLSSPATPIVIVFAGLPLSSDGQLPCARIRVVGCHHHSRYRSRCSRPRWLRFPSPPVSVTVYTALLTSPLVPSATETGPEMVATGTSAYDQRGDEQQGSGGEGGAGHCAWRGGGREHAGCGQRAAATAWSRSCDRMLPSRPEVGLPALPEHAEMHP